MKVKKFLYNWLPILIAGNLLLFNIFIFLQIWNVGVVYLFPTLPILSYKEMIVLYLIKSLFGLDVDVSLFFKETSNSIYKNIQPPFIQVAEYLINGLFYLFVFIIIKLLI